MVSVLNVVRSVSAWYDLRFTRPRSLVVEIEPAVMGFVIEVLHQENPYTVNQIPDARQRLAIPEFIAPHQHGRNWGFGELLIPRQAERFPSWCAYELRLPVLCREGQWDWRAGYAASATLGTLFFLLQCQVEGGKDPQEEQLICIEGMLTESFSMHGSSISVALSEKVMAWLGTQEPESEAVEVAGAMRQAYGHMYPDQAALRLYDTSFAAQASAPTPIRMVVPGNCCCLADSNRHRRYGSLLSSHNCDSPLQQLTFLAGIAALNGAVRGSLRE